MLNAASPAEVGREGDTRADLRIEIDEHVQELVGVDLCSGGYISMQWWVYICAVSRIERIQECLTQPNMQCHKQLQVCLYRSTPMCVSTCVFV